MKTRLELTKEIKEVDLTSFNITTMLVNSYYIDLQNNLIGYVTDRSRDAETIEEEKQWEIYEEYHDNNGYELTSVLDIQTIGHFDFIVFTFENKGL
jgi:hypothetical protein